MVAPTVLSTPKTGYADAFWCTYLVSVVAASVAEVVTYPLDLTKTRLQVQGERAAQLQDAASSARSCARAAPPPGRALVYRGMVRTAMGIAREEGVLSLWRGVTPAIYRHVVYSGIRIVTYERLRDRVFQRDPASGAFPVWKSAICGVTSGALAQLVASPTDLVKVQVQTEGRRLALGLPPRVHGAWDALCKIIAQGGLRALWKGSVPNVQRAALVNLGDLTTYDSAKRLILKHTALPDSHVTHSLASACAGLVAATMGTPADVVKTRVMNQPTDQHGRGLLYKSSYDCLTKTVQLEGFMALYKGFLPVWIRMAPWSLTFWLTFEKIRHMIGSSAF